MDRSEYRDLLRLAERDMFDPIPQETLDEVLSTPPFIAVPGTFNVRDLGAFGAPYIRTGRIYRSGMLGYLTEEGKKRVSDDMGVRLVLDLRAARERASIPPPDIPGVKFAWIPSEGAQTHLDLNDFVGERGGEKGYTKMYLEIMEEYAASFRHALEHIRDDADSDGGILFHCSAGKDRTAVLAAILMGLAGVPDAAIAAEYSLTRIGMEPRKELFSQIFLQSNPDWTPDTPGFSAFATMKASYMLEFLDAVREKYGGMEGYAKSRLGMSDEDVSKIRLALKE
ncbi:protein-tyrosine phosphatase-like protein [Aspergillus ambiguus]|uniref:tyrosine-protein phosphatase n=1 Tax=Aspergillus ambiguus TaxID=176160 RepID=UPI003CCD7782